MRIDGTDYNVEVCAGMAKDEFLKLFPKKEKHFEVIQKSVGKKAQKKEPEKAE